MNSEKNILIAFILNLLFAIFEIIGGAFTGSIAILSDALHDIGDALSIGISFLFEKKSKRPPDSAYTLGYGRYSVIGGMITTAILILGSITVIYHAIVRILNPITINYNGMIMLAIIGFGVNLTAAYFTHEGDSLNQKAVNLHMFEDVLGWAVVLIGSVIMKFVNIPLIDPIISICVAIFILISSIKNLKEIFSVLLEKIPDGYSVEDIKKHILSINDILDVHHISIWTTDTQNIYATMHIKTKGEFADIKRKVRENLKEHGINYATLELESENESYNEVFDALPYSSNKHKHHCHHRCH